MVTGAGWDLGGDAPVVPRENLRKIRKSNSESPAIPWNFCAPSFCFFFFLIFFFRCLLACLLSFSFVSLFRFWLLVFYSVDFILLVGFVYP